MSVFRNYFRDARGSVALLFATALPTLVIASGVAYEYSESSGIQSALQASTDSAALAAARAYTVNGGNKDDAEAKGLAALKANFSIQSSKAATMTESVVKMTKNNPPTFSARSTTEVTRRFGKIMGINSGTVSVESVAEVRQKGGVNPVPEEVPTDLVIAMDVSASMGLASSVADRNKLAAAVGAEVAKTGAPSSNANCAFACHNQNWWPHGNKTTLDLARENNVALRFDVQKIVIQQAVDALLKGGSKVDHRIGLFSFDEKLTKIADLTSNRGTLTSALVKQDFGVTGTYYEVVFPSLQTEISKMLANKAFRPEANKTLLIITDGMRTKPWGNDNVDIYAIRESSCNMFKTLGINVAIVELKYLPESIKDHWNYPYFATQIPLISPTLKSCASSPNLYGVAGDTTDIIKEFERVRTNSVTATTRLPALVR